MAGTRQLNGLRPASAEPRTFQPSRRWAAASRPILVLCLSVFGVLAFTSLRQDSATWDETHYLGLGQHLAETGRWDVPGSILHPPLSFYLNSIPLLFIPTDPGLWQLDATRRDEPNYLALADTDRGQRLLSSSANANDRLLTASRLVMVLLAAILGVFAFAWSDRLYGPAGGIAAAMLFALSPNILAHARLITPDIAVTTFSFIAIYYLWRLLDEGRARHGAAGGLSLGLAFLSKFTGALLFPVCVLLVALSWIHRRAVNWRGVLVYVSVGVAVLLFGYGLDMRPYFAGIAYQWQHANTGHASFLFGEISTTGWWYYLAAAFAIKTPIATMILLAIALRHFAHGIRRGAWFPETFLVVPALAIAAFFSINHQSIGLRYLLPAYPFIFVLAGGSVSVLATHGRGRLLCAALGLWYVVTSLAVYPHYLAYFNEFVGGPRNGYRYLVDSNLDWGQELKRLKQYMNEQDIAQVSLSYFGSDDPSRYGIRYAWLPSYILRDPRPQDREFAPSSWVAISATNLQGVYFGALDPFKTFRDRTPDAVIGYSLFLYHLNL